ncbi:MAG: V-type ATP synthase subunit E [Spirochaetales bacterium]|nr:V-type ATP synthase subunit E [Spirochaetales bacterium]
MEGKLQELTDRLYREGVEKASTEAKAILEKAQKEAQVVITKAKAEAEAVTSAAKNEAEQLKSKALSEVKMAGEQAIATLKLEITNLLTASALSSGVKTSFQDVAFVQELIKELVAKWDPKNAELDLVLPASRQKELSQAFQAKSSEILAKGVELKFEARMDGGFRIEPKDGSFVLSFTDRDFLQFFQSFLKARAKEILFPAKA